jgi:hypothetical protein
MMNDSRPPRQQTEIPGLCGACRFGCPIVNDRGSRFLRCAMADQDPAFPRYPPLPVFACRGYTRTVSE